MSVIKVLNFHELNKQNDVKWFEDIIIYLKNKKKIISCNDLNNYLNNDINLKDSYVLTVDDGHKSFYNNIYPIIKKHKVPIALFVSPKICKNKENFWGQEISDYDEVILKKIFSKILKIPFSVLTDLGVRSIFKSLKIHQIKEVILIYQKKMKLQKKEFQNMTIDNLIEVYNSKLVTIGAHTMNHPILFNEEDSVSKYEIQESILELGNILDCNIKYFAYPYGMSGIDYSKREMEFVKEMDVNISFSTNFKKAKKSSNKIEIPRGELSNGYLNFKEKLFLWEYWQYIIKLKNGRKALKDIKVISNLLKR